MILAHGRGWMAIDKPAESSTHNAGAESSAPDAVQIAERLLDSDGALRASVQPEAGFRPAPVHRLDVGTSGVLLIACARDTARELQQSFETTHPEKIYLAICKGQPSPAEGEWTWALSERAEGRRDPQGRPPHKACVTRYRVLRATAYVSLLEARLESGRTHQIRRHAALARHPLIGDRRYSTSAHADRMKEIYGVDRLALHHHRLVLKRRDETIDIVSPLPQELERLLTLKEGATN